MTDKQRALQLLQAEGLTWQKVRCNPFDNTRDIEIYRKDGKELEPQLHSLVCRNWRDVIERLK